jgi:hypothetical protein
MNPSSPLKSLRVLAAVRERAVERLAVEMAGKAAERERYRRNLERMAALGGQESSQALAAPHVDGSRAGAASDAQPASAPMPAAATAAAPAAALLAVARSMNASLYKQTLLRLAETHRTDLALHEADMAVTQGALTQALGKREAIGQVLAGHLKRLVESEQRSDRRRQDELAGQWWLRTPGR